MDKYYKYKASGPDIQSGLESKVKIETWKDSDEGWDEFLNVIGYDWCAENYSQYKDIEEEEEESGIEWEANFYFTPITKEEYDSLDNLIECVVW